MDHELSTKTQYLTTLYKLALQLILALLYCGKYIFVIINVIAIGCRDCCVGSIAAITKQLEIATLEKETDEQA